MSGTDDVFFIPAVPAEEPDPPSDPLARTLAVAAFLFPAQGSQQAEIERIARSVVPPTESLVLSDDEPSAVGLELVDPVSSPSDPGVAVAPSRGDHVHEHGFVTLINCSEHLSDVLDVIDDTKVTGQPIVGAGALPDPLHGPGLAFVPSSKGVAVVSLGGAGHLALGAGSRASLPLVASTIDHRQALLRLAGDFGVEMRNPVESYIVGTDVRQFTRPNIATAALPWATDGVDHMRRRRPLRGGRSSGTATANSGLFRVQDELYADQTSGGSGVIAGGGHAMYPGEHGAVLGKIVASYRPKLSGSLTWAQPLVDVYLGVLTNCDVLEVAPMGVPYADATGPVRFAGLRLRLSFPADKITDMTIVSGELIGGGEMTVATQLDAIDIVRLQAACKITIDNVEGSVSSGVKVGRISLGMTWLALPNGIVDVAFLSDDGVTLNVGTFNAAYANKRVHVEPIAMARTVTAPTAGAVHHCLAMAHREAEVVIAG